MIYSLHHQIQHLFYLRNSPFSSNLYLMPLSHNIHGMSKNIFHLDSSLKVTQTFHSFIRLRNYSSQFLSIHIIFYLMYLLYNFSSIQYKPKSFIFAITIYMFRLTYLSSFIISILVKLCQKNL